MRELTLPDLWREVRTKFLFYAQAGMGKSTLIAKAGKPMLVFLFDPWDKAAPYFDRGNVRIEEINKNHNIGYVTSRKTDNLLIQVENFFDTDPEHPSAWRYFIQRCTNLRQEIIEQGWTSLVYDSCTFMELLARGEDQFNLNPTHADKRSHYAVSKDFLEMQLLRRAVNFPCNVFVVCHVDTEKDESQGKMLYNPSFPGKLQRTINAGYSEIYRPWIYHNADEPPVFCLQTVADGNYSATSAKLHVPNGTAQNWRDILAPYCETHDITLLPAKR